MSNEEQLIKLYILAVFWGSIFYVLSWAFFRGWRR